MAVIEVGLGGRLDCTNIITPELSVITNISLDHTQFLGNTLALIAGEKAGIIKPHVPVVIGEDLPETRTVFQKKADECGAPIVFAQDHPEVVSSESCLNGGRDYQTSTLGEIHGDLGGDCQEKNMNTVLAAARLLKERFSISNEGMTRALANVCRLTGLHGRWETLCEKPHVVCDTGHNVGGWQYLAPQIKRQPCKTLRIVFGMVDDKDINTVMCLLPKNAVYYWAQPASKRAFGADKVAELGKQHDLKGINCGSVADAYHKAMSDADTDDFVFVGGSSYVVADLLAL